MYKHILTIAAAITLAACSSGKMNKEYKELQVNTEMSSTVFLEPVAPEKQVIYVRVKSTTGNKGFKLQGAIENAMRANGFRTTNNPEDANFMIDANIRNYTSTRKAPDGTGESIVGAVVGGVLGSAFGGGSGREITTAIGAAAGGAAAQAYATRNLLVSYTAEVDVRVSQRPIGAVEYTTNTNIKQGDSSTSRANYKRTVNWEHYNTKLISTAKKMGLTEEEATPEIVEEIVASLSNMF